MPGLGFLSASNDGSIRLWALSGEVLLEMVGHTSVVYSVDAHVSGLIVSGSKDCFAKIWKDGVCLQSIEHPGWVSDAKFLGNGDIVTACSDGVVRVWTVHHDRIADPQEAELYASLLSQDSFSMKRPVLNENEYDYGKKSYNEGYSGYDLSYHEFQLDGKTLTSDQWHRWEKNELEALEQELCSKWNDEKYVLNDSDEQKRNVEKLQSLAVKFFRLVQRFMSSDISSVVGNLSCGLIFVAERQIGRPFDLDTARDNALQLEKDRKEDLDFSLNILVLGKSGVGKSCTINSIFGEEKARVDAFEPATASVKEIIGVIDGVKILVFDTPGLKSSVLEQSLNRCILDSVKKHTKKYPVDIVLYVDRVDALTRSFDDIYLLNTITRSLESPIWRRVILTLTHASSVPPEGQSSSLNYDAFVAQQSVDLEEHIGQAAGYQPTVDPVLDLPVCLVENHMSCPKNSKGQKVLPNGISWRSQLMILCYSMKIISEANSLSKPRDPSAPRKLFGFLIRLPSMLLSLVHRKPSTGKGNGNVEWRGDLALGFNTTIAQISNCRSSKVSVRARINNMFSGQISVQISSCGHLALASILPEATSIYKKLNPGVGKKSSGYVYGFWLDDLTPISDKWIFKKGSRWAD